MYIIHNIKTILRKIWIHRTVLEKAKKKKIFDGMMVALSSLSLMEENLENSDGCSYLSFWLRFIASTSMLI